MNETVVLRLNYQLVVHRRNEFLHEPIDIAGEVWNYCVCYQRWAYRSFDKYVHKYQMQSHVAALRRDVAAYQHWQLLGSQAVKEISDRVDTAYQRFFKGLGGRPRFRKVKKHRSFVLPFHERTRGRGRGSGVRILDWGENGYGKIRITMGDTRRVFKFHMGKRPLTGTLKSVSVIRGSDGKFRLSFVVKLEKPRIYYPSTGKVGGFDFGLNHFITTDTGETIESPQYLFEEREELRRRTGKLSGRKIIGSGSWIRAELELARLHSQIASRRSDFHWKLAHKLCKRYDVLVFETLNMDGMRRLWGRKIGDLGWYSFLRKLEWVAEKTGRQIIYAPRFYPGSKICSECGCMQASLPLRQREFHCSDCGMVMGRDHNAARNLEQLGRGSVPGKSGDSDLQRHSVSMAPVMTAEPSV